MWIDIQMQKNGWEEYIYRKIEAEQQDIEKSE